MPEYYDYVLGLIPLALVGVSVLLSATGFALTPSVSAGGLAAVSLVGHALFVRGPVDSDPVSPSPSAEDGPAIGPDRAPTAD